MNFRLSEQRWRPATRPYVCRVCGTPAMVNLEDPMLWGCKTCQFTTHSVAFYFKQELSAAEMDKKVVQVFPGEYEMVHAATVHDKRWRCPVDGRYVDRNAGWRMGNEEVCINCYHWYLDKLKELPEFWRTR